MDSFLVQLELEDVRRGIIYVSDSLSLLKQMPDNYAQMIVTSPPYYGLRNYQVDGQTGLHCTLEEYLNDLWCVFDECRRVLRPDGICYVNINDSYSSGNRKTYQGDGIRGMDDIPRPDMPPGCKAKDLLGVPEEFALGMRNRGWYWRSKIIWRKPNSKPESVRDRCTVDFEMVYMFTKSEQYTYYQDAVREPAHDWGDKKRDDGKYTSGKANDVIIGGANSGLIRGNFAETGRNKRSVWGEGKEDWWGTLGSSIWDISNEGHNTSHFATFPIELPATAILSGATEGDIIIDPYSGVQTTGVAALRLGCQYIGIELNPAFAEEGKKRLETDSPYNFVEIKNEW